MSAVFTTKKSVLLAIFVATFCIGIMAGMAATIFPIALYTHGIGEGGVGVSSAVQMASTFLVLFILVPLTVRLGLSTTIKLAVLLQIFALLLLPHRVELWIWLPLVFVFGLGGQSFFLIEKTWLNYTVSVSHRGKVHGLSNATFFLGLSLGPLLARQVGLEGVAPFIVAALVHCITMLMHFLIRGHAPKMDVHPPTRILEIVKQYPIIAAGGITAHFIFFSSLAFLIIYVISHDISKEQAALYVTAFTIGNAVLTAGIGWLVDHFHRRTIITSAAIVSLACSLSLPWAMQSMFVAWIVLMLWSSCFGATISTCMAHLGKQHSGSKLVAVNTVYLTISAFGTVLGPLVTGLCMELFGKQGFPIATGAAATLYIGFILIMRFRR